MIKFDTDYFDSNWFDTEEVAVVHAPAPPILLPPVLVSFSFAMSLKIVRFIALTQDFSFFVIRRFEEIKQSFSKFLSKFRARISLSSITISRWTASHLISLNRSVKLGSLIRYQSVIARKIFVHFSRKTLVKSMVRVIIDLLDDIDKL